LQETYTVISIYCHADNSITESNTDSVMHFVDIHSPGEYKSDQLISLKKLMKIKMKKGKLPEKSKSDSNLTLTELLESTIAPKSSKVLWIAHISSLEKNIAQSFNTLNYIKEIQQEKDP